MIDYKKYDNKLIIISEHISVTLDYNTYKHIIPYIDIYNKSKYKFLINKIKNLIINPSKLSEEKLQRKIEKHKKKKKLKNAKKINNNVYLKGYNIEIPTCFLKKFNDEVPTSYINFLKLLHCNPILEIREKLPEYIINNNLMLTPNGYIVGCRQVWKIEDGINNESELIISLYNKVKTKWKKNPKNVFISDFENGKISEIKDNEESLESMYLNTNKETVTKYRSDFGKYKDYEPENWQIGNAYEFQDRSFYNTNVDCGDKMFHIRSNPRELSGYGDTNIMVLINPQDVISCVLDWKFGVCKFYFAAILETDDLEMFHNKLPEFEHDYMDHEWNVIETSLDKEMPINFKNEVITHVVLKDFEKIIKERKIILNK